MLKKLFELYETKELACLYTNAQDLGKFHFGRVIAVNEKEVAIQDITPDGEDDGISVMDAELVIRIDTNGQYCEKMKKLCFENALPSYNLQVRDNNILLSVLTLAVNKKQIISVELLDSGYNDIVGFAEKIEDGECVIREVDEYGCEDGFSYISVDNITQISYASKDEKRIMRLWNLNK